MTLKWCLISLLLVSNYIYNLSVGVVRVILWQVWWCGQVQTVYAKHKHFVWCKKICLKTELWTLITLCCVFGDDLVGVLAEFQPKGYQQSIDLLIHCLNFVFFNSLSVLIFIILHLLQQEEKIYVQHKLLENSFMMWDLLANRGAWCFLAGWVTLHLYNK